MLRDFEHFDYAVGELGMLQELKGLRVAVDASHYLETRVLSSNYEPLVCALGGLPFGFRSRVELDLAYFSKYEIEPVFIFSGIDISRPGDPFRQRQQGVEVNQEAWGLYNRHQANDSVHKFKESRYVQPEDLFRALQDVLAKYKIRFMIAPYSSLPLMIYMQEINKVAAIAGPSELLLYPCDRFITSWDFEDQQQFKHISRDDCIKELQKTVANGDVSKDAFVDACLLAGSRFLPTLPSLESAPRDKMAKPLAAIDLMWSHGRTGINTVRDMSEDPRLKELHYFDNYCKVRSAIRYEPIITVDGAVESRYQAQMPNDANEFIDHRLPEELFYYLSRGLIDPRILTWRIRGEVIETIPPDGGEPVAYRELISSKLVSCRKTVLNLLSESLHNWFQHVSVTQRCWFLDASTGRPVTNDLAMNIREETRDKVGSWNVQEETFASVVSQYKACGILGCAVLCLQNEDFVSKSCQPRNAQKFLSSDTEVLYNSLWRFLAVRDYVDTKHNLTNWGKMLVAVIAALDGKPQLEEAAFLAVELLRLDMLNGDKAMCAPYFGSPFRGDESDQKYCLLVSQLAGLGELHHNQIGFTGPLSKHLSGYNSVINAVRGAARDIVEVSATQMFFSNRVDRDAVNVTEVALKLPFLLPKNCGLSLAVMSYLEELTVHKSDRFDKEGTIRNLSENFFPQTTDIRNDLNSAWQLWDAVYKGVKSHKSLFTDANMGLWSNANMWLSEYR